MREGKIVMFKFCEFLCGAPVPNSQTPLRHALDRCWPSCLRVSVPQMCIMSVLRTVHVQFVLWTLHLLFNFDPQAQGSAQKGRNSIQPFPMTSFMPSCDNWNWHFHLFCAPEDLITFCLFQVLFREWLQLPLSSRFFKWMFITTKASHLWDCGWLTLVCLCVRKPSRIPISFCCKLTGTNRQLLQFHSETEAKSLNMTFVIMWHSRNHGMTHNVTSMREWQAHKCSFCKMTSVGSMPTRCKTIIVIFLCLSLKLFHCNAKMMATQEKNGDKLSLWHLWISCFETTAPNLSTVPLGGQLFPSFWNNWGHLPNDHHCTTVSSNWLKWTSKLPKFLHLWLLACKTSQRRNSWSAMSFVLRTKWN